MSAALLGSACTEAPAAGDCSKLFGHLVDLQAQQVKASDADKAEYKASIEADKRGEFVQRCERDIKASQVTCSLSAKTMKELEACDSKG